MADTADTADTVEAPGTTGLAVVISGMAFLGMAIAIISTLITAAGNGAPTARSMSATLIDSRREGARPAEGSGEFLDTMTITAIVWAWQPISLHAHRPAGPPAGICLSPSNPIRINWPSKPQARWQLESRCLLHKRHVPERTRPCTHFALASRPTRVEPNRERKPGSGCGKSDM